MSYFSDNDGDALLGAQHLFVAGFNGTGVVGFNLGTSSVDLSWQSSAGPLSLAGVGAGDQLIVNQAGNADGSTTLVALTPSSPSSNQCATCCEATAAVSNSTLVAYDFGGAMFSPTLGTSVPRTNTSLSCPPHRHDQEI